MLIPLIPLGIIMRAVIVPLIPTLLAAHNSWELSTRIVTRLPGKF
jgi:hypothetical protein